MSHDGWLMHHVHLLDDSVTDWAPSPDDSLPRMPFPIADMLIVWWLTAYESHHVTLAAFMYKRLQLLPWVPISTSCGFGTQVSFIFWCIMYTNLTCGFGTQTLSPWAWFVPPHCPTSRPSPLLTYSYSCNCCLLSAQCTSSLRKSPVPPVVGVVRPHS
jgi:hypothetical protein